ncbi:unnamed protein product [marine sediment metagenome]|uniref:Uncharacterized protein n=1 Tax=marine sediment metagenome TaxID=412755 RepID=X1TZ40_9ZZZZ
MAESKLAKEQLKNLKLRNKILKLREKKLQAEIDQIEEMAENYYIEKAIEVAKVLPWKEILLSGVLMYGWKEAGDNKEITVADVLLGIIGGFTLEDALRGGIAANAYAVGYLSSLGVTSLGTSGVLDDVSKLPELVVKSFKGITEREEKLRIQQCRFSGGTWDPDLKKCLPSGTFGQPVLGKGLNGLKIPTNP